MKQEANVIQLQTLQKHKAETMSYTNKRAYKVGDSWSIDKPCSLANGIGQKELTILEIEGELGAKMARVQDPAGRVAIIRFANFQYPTDVSPNTTPKTKIEITKAEVAGVAGVKAESSFSPEIPGRVESKPAEKAGNDIALRQRAEEMLTQRSYTTGDAFDALYDDILAHFNEHESSEAENGIGNLALLDSGSNRGYKNAVFPIKRRRLLQYDQEGTFVPLCTRNAFLKCYSQKVENMFFWGIEDQTDYREAMIKTLAHFFSN